MSHAEERATLEAFGSTALVAVTDAGALATARAVVERIVAEFDHACSRFRDDSELSAVNAAAGAAVQVGPVLLEAVTVALRAARLTGGDVDPTVGQALISLGYDRDFAALSPGEDGRGGVARGAAAGVGSGWRTVTVDPERSTIRVAGGVSLDLGATAKALAADRAAAEASAAAGCGVLVSFGGDLAIAGPAPAEGWRIRVTDDHRSGFDAPGQWISLSSGGLATSSTAVRQWRTDSGHRAPPDRSAHRAVRRQRVAHGQRVRRLVRGREHREHRDDRPRREGGAVARGARAAEPARAHERHRAPRRRAGPRTATTCRSWDRRLRR